MSATEELAEVAVDKSLQYLEAFESLVEKHAPEVIDTGLAVVQVHAVGEIIIAVITGGLAFAAFKCSRSLLQKSLNNRHDGVLEGFGAVFSATAGLFCLLGTIPIFQIWTWVAIFEPKLYLAYRLFSKIL